MAETPSERHQAILDLIRDGESPVMPFEIAVAELALQGLASEQGALGRTLRAAMTESSETWHDNSAADAVASESKVLFDRAKHRTAAISHGVEVGYPASDERLSTLGSVVLYHFAGDDDERLGVFITGVTRDVPEEVKEMLEVDDDIDFSVATIGSALVKAVFNKEAGATVDFSPTERKTFQIVLDEVRQFAPAAVTA